MDSQAKIFNSTVFKYQERKINREKDIDRQRNTFFFHIDALILKLCGRYSETGRQTDRLKRPISVSVNVEMDRYIDS